MNRNTNEPDAERQLDAMLAQWGREQRMSDAEVERIPARARDGGLNLVWWEKVLERALAQTEAPVRVDVLLRRHLWPYLPEGRSRSEAS